MTFDPQRRYARTYADPYEVDYQLDRIFGLTRLPFEEAVRSGDHERRRTTKDDALGADGYYAWTRTLRTLRGGTRQVAGWHRGDFRRIPVTLSNDETKAIAVSSGDERTGRDGEDPATKNIKGWDAAVAVEHNRLRFNDISPFDDDPVEFYYLLYYLTDQGMWAEVSEPLFQADDGRITGWGTRLLLGEILPHGGRTTRRPADPVGPAKPIDVLVNRKVS